MAEQIPASGQWRRTQADTFWSEIAPCDHVVQIYEDDESLIKILSQFVIGGLNAGDGVIVIGTQQHLDILEFKLLASGIDVSSCLNTRYFPLDAEQTLAKFMVNGWPDETLFMNLVSNVVNKARQNNRKVRAFGEMVVLLWEQGSTVATVQLEHLWNKFSENEMFCLFCAYPKSAFSHNIGSSEHPICSAHSKVITLSHDASSDILYSRVDQKELNKI
jgi:hypothetical protein